MKDLFKEKTQVNTQTPGQTAMKGLFHEAPANAPKTPNQAAMKTLFKEDNEQIGNKTPNQVSLVLSYSTSNFLFSEL